MCTPNVLQCEHVAKLVGLTNLARLLADDCESSVTLPSSLKEESLATASILSCPVEAGESNIAAVTMLESDSIAPGICATCVTIDTSDFKSPETIPSELRGTLLVNTSNTIGLYYMGQTLASDIINTMSPGCEFNKGCGPRPPTLCLGQRPI